MKASRSSSLSQLEYPVKPHQRYAQLASTTHPTIDTTPPTMRRNAMPGRRLSRGVTRSFFPGGETLAEIDDCVAQEKTRRRFRI
jgi:hypothetical protein